MDMEEAKAAFVDAAVKIGMETAKGIFEEALSPGGELYETYMRRAILGGKMWYGMYKPKVYKRGYTLTDRGNIAINVGDIKIVGTRLEASVSIDNLSPHLGFTKGFDMPNGEHRPGGDVFAMIPSELSMKWEAPKEVLEQILSQAAQLVFG